MTDKFKVGDVISYGFYACLKVIKVEYGYYILEDQQGNSEKIYKSLVNKHGVKINGEA